MSPRFSGYIQSAKKLLLSPPFVVFVICAALLAFNLYSAYQARPFSSDDVAWQTQMISWRPFDGTTAAQGMTAPFVSKIPFYIFMDHFFSPSRRLLFFESYFFQLFSFGALYVTALYFLRRQKSKLSYLNLLPFIWLASFGYDFARMFLNSNWRAPDLGITFLTFLVTALLFQKKYQSSVPSKRLHYAILVGIALVAGCLIYSDPHYLYFTVAPLVAFAAWLRYRKVINTKQLTVVASVAVLSLIAAKIVKSISIASGIKIMTDYPVQFVTYDVLFSKIALTIQCLLLSFGANFFGTNLASLQAVSGVLNFLLVSVIVVITWGICRRYLKKPADATDTQAHWYFFFSLISIEAIALFTFSTIAADLSTYRYFIVVLFASVLVLTLKLSTVSGTPRLLASLLLLTAIAGNVLVTQTGTLTKFLTTGDNLTTNKANALNYTLIDTIEKTGVRKGYANYWQANINTYLSKERVQAHSVLCNGGKTYPFYWLTDESQYGNHADRSFYLHDPDIGAPLTCTLEEVKAEFGEPLETITVQNKSILIYDYDISTKLPGVNLQ